MGVEVWYRAGSRGGGGRRHRPRNGLGSPGPLRWAPAGPVGEQPAGHRPSQGGCRPPVQRVCPRPFAVGRGRGGAESRQPPCAFGGGVPPVVISVRG